MLRRVLKTLCLQCGHRDKTVNPKTVAATPEAPPSPDRASASKKLPQAPLDQAISCDEVATDEGFVNITRPYHSYQPTERVNIRKLPVHYWFYVFVYSSESDSLMAPLVELCKDDICRDRRLLAIMNRCKVSVHLARTELYKALPRHLISVRGVSWRAVVQAMVELEDAFPKLMRFATHPLLMDANTCRFSSSQFHRTALQTRQTRH